MRQHSHRQVIATVLAVTASFFALSVLVTRTRTRCKDRRYASAAIVVTMLPTAAPSYRSGDTQCRAKHRRGDGRQCPLRGPGSGGTAFTLLGVSVVIVWVDVTRGLSVGRK